MLTSTQIADIYSELSEMTVLVHQQPQLGFTYYADFIASARVKQDRLGDLIIKVNGERARARVQLRCLKELKQLDPEDAMLSEVVALENAADELRFLADSLDTKAKLVRNSIYDVRLLIQIMESQLKLGEVQPPEPATAPEPSADQQCEISTAGTSESAKMAEDFLTSEPVPYQGRRPH